MIEIYKLFLNIDLFFQKKVNNKPQIEILRLIINSVITEL